MTVSKKEFQRLQTLLALAINIASDAHVYQKDKGGFAYILHPLRLMFSLIQSSACIQVQILAILHDVIEDSEITIDDLRELGFDEEILEALSLLTHNKNVSYAEYIKGIASNEWATQVKMEDLKDNSDITRLKGLREKDLIRIDKYNHAFAYLSNRIDEMPDNW